MEKIGISYGIGSDCTKFKKGRKFERVPRVIYPRIVITGEDANEPRKERATIISGCSFYENCENPDCVFSTTTKKLKEKERDQLTPKEFVKEAVG